MGPTWPAASVTTLDGVWLRFPPTANVTVELFAAVHS
jgi:hypothetical protein